MIEITDLGKLWLFFAYLLQTTETYSSLHLKTALGFNGHNLKIRKTGLIDGNAQKKYIQFQMIPNTSKNKGNLNKDNLCQIFQNPQRKNFVEIYTVRCNAIVLASYITIQTMDNGTLVKVDEFKHMSEPRRIIR